MTGSRTWTSRSTQQLEQAGRRRAVSSAEGVARPHRAGGGRAPEGKEAGRLAPPRARLALDEPLARRLHGVLRLPARMSVVPLVHALRPALVAALGRARELPFLFSRTSRCGRRCRNTLWLMAVFVPLQVLFAFGVALHALARATRGRLLPDGLLSPGARPAGRRDARFRLPPQPGDGPREHRSSAISASRGRSGSTRPRGRSRR